MQSLTNSIEATIALQEVTNVVKSAEAIYQAATQVKVLSPEIVNIIEADVLVCAQGSMKDDAKGKSSLTLSGSKSVAWHEMEFR